MAYNPCNLSRTEEGEDVSHSEIRKRYGATKYPSNGTRV